MASGDPEIEVSPLSGSVMRDGVTMDLAIDRMAGSDEGCTLEVVDAVNTSTVWDGRFETDSGAYAEFQHCLDEEGIELLLVGDVARSLH